MIKPTPLIENTDSNEKSKPKDNIICAWCKKKLGYNPEIENGKISHGICKECEKKFFNEETDPDSVEFPTDRRIKLITKMKMESVASEQAKKLGYVYAGYGRWKNSKGKIVAKTINNKLVKVTTNKNFVPTKKSKRVSQSASKNEVLDYLKNAKKYGVKVKKITESIVTFSPRILPYQPHPKIVKNLAFKQAFNWRFKLDSDSQYRLRDAQSLWQRHDMYFNTDNRKEVNEIITRIAGNPKNPATFISKLPLVRGVDTSPKMMIKFLKRFKVGKTLTSTPVGFSQNPRIAESFGIKNIWAKKPRGSIFLRLHANPETKLIHGLQLSYYTDALIRYNKLHKTKRDMFLTTDKDYDDEEEVVIPGNLKMKVSKITLFTNVPKKEFMAIVDLVDDGLEQTAGLTKEIQDPDEVDFVDDPRIKDIMKSTAQVTKPFQYQKYDDNGSNKDDITV